MLDAYAILKRQQVIFIAGLMFLILAAAPSAGAAPISDGLFDQGEGYTAWKWVVYDKGESDGKLYTYRDPATGDLSVALVQSLVSADNTYGVNSIGWGDKGHKFKELLGSDEASFVIKNSSGKKILDLTIDYIEQVGTDFYGNPLYASMLKQGKKKKPKPGDPAPGPLPVLDSFGTSLEYNFNVLGYQLTEDSPLTNENYDTLDPQYAGWIYESVYEFTIAGSLLGSGWVDVEVDAHNSPKKGVRATPVPAAVWLLGSGLFGLAALKRRKAA